MLSQKKCGNFFQKCDKTVTKTRVADVKVVLVECYNPQCMLINLTYMSKMCIIFGKDASLPFRGKPEMIREKVLGTRDPP